MSDTIANAPGLDLAPILARADAADIPALVAEVQKLRTALSHAIDVGFVAVGEALREGEEARARILFLESRDRLRLLEIGILGDKRDAALTRLAALESAPTFADGVRAMKATALAAVSTCCESAYADIERIDPSTVKPC